MCAHSSCDLHSNAMFHLKSHHQFSSLNKARCCRYWLCPGSLPQTNDESGDKVASPFSHNETEASGQVESCEATRGQIREEKREHVKYKGRFRERDVCAKLSEGNDLS